MTIAALTALAVFCLCTVGAAPATAAGLLLEAEGFAGLDAGSWRFHERSHQSGHLGRGIAWNAYYDAGGSIVQTVQVAEEGDYHVWVRYCKYGEYFAPFFVTVTQRDRVLADRFVYTPKDAPKGVRGWVWHQLPEPVKLQRGRATVGLSIRGRPVPIPEGKLTARHVDAVLLTTDTGFSPTSVQSVEPFRAAGKKAVAEGRKPIVLPKDSIYLRVEAETLDPGDSQWKVANDASASDGRTLFSTYYDASDAARGNVVLPAGRFRVWTRFYNRQKRHGQFRFTLFDEDGAIVAQKLMATRPAEQTGPRWDSAVAIIPRAATYRLQLARTTYSRSPYDARKIDLILITDDFALTPDLSIARAASTSPPRLPASAAAAPRDTPVVSTAAMNDWRLFCGLPVAPGELYSREREPFWLSVRQCPSSDVVQMFRYGGNTAEEHRPGLANLQAGSVLLRSLPESFAEGIRTKGHVVTADGKAAKRHSIFYPPFRQYVLDWSAKCARELATKEPGHEVIGWTLTNEMGGYFDWSEYAQAAFRKWLAKRYGGEIVRLNDTWVTKHASFDAVPPPRDRQNLAAWIDWWRFHEAAWADIVGREAVARHEADPHRRPVVVKFSDLDLEYANFVGKRCIDYELMEEALKPAGGGFAMDIYGAGDLTSFEAELLRSIHGPGFWFTEHNQHGPDPRLMQASLWSATAKGCRGMFLFCWGGLNATRHNDWVVFGMHTPDGEPKPRMLTAAQYFHGVRRLEPLLLESQRVRPRQVVGLYYPRLDIGVGGLPAKSKWGETVNPLIPVYATLRRLGYPVDIVTERQLTKGKLDELAAMVFVNAQHLPATACRRLIEFVERGGAVIGDIRTGWYDDHHREQRALEALFGVEEAADSYDTEADNEVQVAPRAQHPVAVGAGDFFCQSRGRQRVTLRNGAAAVATLKAGGTCAVVNRVGKGHTLYFATMAGSFKAVHGGSADPLIGEFLRWAGVQPQYRTKGLSRAATRNLRIEPVWADRRGNQYVILTNFGASPVGPFELGLPPEANSNPLMALWADARSTALRPAPLKRDDARATATLPGVDTAGVLLLLRDHDPLLSVVLEGANEHDTGLPVLRPGQKAVLRITMHSPSQRSQAATTVRVHTLRGWYQEALVKPVPALRPAESAHVDLAVRVPPTEREQIAPLTVKLERNGQAVGTPCTVIVRTK